MLSALRQQHALELSTAESRSRALQTAVFDAEAQVHALQRQVGALEDELAQLRPLRPLSRGSSHGTGHGHAHAHGPGAQSSRRPAARAVDRSDDLRRASFSSLRQSGGAGGPSPPPARSAFEGLSAEARHKRKVSLSMLKARIESEVAASSHMPRPGTKHPHAHSHSPHGKAVGLPAVIEPPSQPATPPPHTHLANPKRPVFMDESHIFWCHSCQGDLVVL